jgi:hypothetical protein
VSKLDKLVAALTSAPLECTHVNAPARAHHCPDCSRTLRRCCLSALGQVHRWGCPAEEREKEGGEA